MKLVFSDGAKSDLRRIGKWIARHNPARAVTFVDELVARCTKLTEMPHAYPLMSHHGNIGIRRVVHGHYLILYRVTAGTVEIVHVLHGSQDFESILRKKKSQPG